MQPPQTPALLVFSGGTAFNSVAGKVHYAACHQVLQELMVVILRKAGNRQSLLADAGTLRSFTTRVAHVLPVSDDGGSTAEIVRVLGGPAVGDIRSRCLRLADDSNTEVHTLACRPAHTRQANSYSDFSL